MNLSPQIKQKKTFIIFLCVLFVLIVVGYSGNNFFRKNQVTTGLILNEDNFVESESAGMSLGLAGNSADLSLKQTSKTTPMADVARAAGKNSPLIEKKIIKNGSLALFVDDPTQSIEAIKKITEETNGFVENSQLYENANGTKSGTITVRIPAISFMDVYEKIKQTAKEVERENINSKDVTDQYIDLDAQLRNLRAEEKQYLDIMNRAQTIDETLNVASHLSDVRGRIERIQGQLQYLSRQIDMSTINITLTSYDDVKVFGLHWKPLYEIKKSFRSLLEGLSVYFNFVVNIIINLPVIILWVVTIGAVILGGWKLLRWLFKRFF